MKKITTLILALAIALTATGCKREPVTPEGNIPAGTAATIGAAKIHAESFTYFFGDFANIQESEDEAGREFKDFQNETMEDGKTYLEAGIEYAIDTAAYEAIINTLFDDSKIVLTDEDKKEAEDEFNSYVTYFGGEEAFAEAIKLNGMTTEFFKESLLTFVKFNRYLEGTYGENGSKAIPADEIQKTCEESFYRVKHILIKTVDDNFSPLSAEEVAKADALKDVLLAQLAGGADFDALMTEYGQDPGMVQDPEGYVIDSGTSFDPAFLKTALALEIGAYDVTEGGAYGHHIIKRFPLRSEDLDKTYINDTSGQYTYKAVAFNMLASELLNNDIDAYKASGEIVRDQAVIDSCIEISFANHTHDADAS